MAVFRRFDRATIGAIEEIAAGGLRIPATLARTGIQEYRDANGGIVREYRPPETVFAPASLASFASAPVTIGHPREDVTPENRQALAVGHVSDTAPAKVEDLGHQWVAIPVIVTRADAIGSVRSKKLTELSVGYSVDIDATPGVTPQGEKYDAIQRSISVNHVALLPSGHARAGKGARLRVDGHETRPKGTKMIRFDGVDYEEGSPELAAAMRAAIDKSRADAIQAKADAAEAAGKAAAALAAANARADAAEAAASDEAIAKRADEIATVLVRTRSIVGDSYDGKGKSADAMRLDAINHAIANGAAIELIDSADWRKGVFAALAVPARKADDNGDRYRSKDTETDRQDSDEPLTFADHVAKVGAARLKGSK